MASRLVIVRHGETEWSRAGRHTGRTDIPLDDAGRACARALGPMLAHWEFAAVYTSPLSRARETCELAGYGDREVLLDDLVEWDYGDYEGLTTEQIREQRPGWALWRDGVPGGEALAHVADRARHVLTTTEGDGADVLLVSHGHLLRVVTALWLDLPAVRGERFALATGAPSVLGHEHEWTALEAWNLRVNT